MNPTFRQEVLNVVLAQLLQERGVISEPESVLKVAGEEARRIPDVLIRYQGLRTVIEGEIDDQPDAQSRALAAARRRVEQGIAHIGIGVFYPSELRGVRFESLKDELARRKIGIGVVTEAGETLFGSGGIDQLEYALRRSIEQLMQQDVVGRAKAVLENAVERFAELAAGKPGWLGRLAKELGIDPLPRPAKEEPGGEES